MDECDYSVALGLDRHQLTIVRSNAFLTGVFVQIRKRSILGFRYDRESCPVAHANAI